MIAIQPSAADDTWQWKPLTWRGLRPTEGGRSATVSCDRGHIATLTNHEIAPDGTVTPSLVCPEEGCSWHEHIELIGWKAA